MTGLYKVINSKENKAVYTSNYADCSNCCVTCLIGYMRVAKSELIERYRRGESVAKLREEWNDKITNDKYAYFVTDEYEEEHDSPFDSKATKNFLERTAKWQAYKTDYEFIMNVLHSAY